MGALERAVMHSALEPSQLNTRVNTTMPEKGEKKYQSRVGSQVIGGARRRNIDNKANKSSPPKGQALGRSRSMIVSKYLLRSATRRIHSLAFLFAFHIFKWINFSLCDGRSSGHRNGIPSNWKFMSGAEVSRVEDVFASHFFRHIMLRLKCLWSLNNPRLEELLAKHFASKKSSNVFPPLATQLLFTFPASLPPPFRSVMSL